MNQLLVDRVYKRQSNMVSRQVNEWTSEQVACIKDKVTDEQSSLSNKFMGERVACAGLVFNVTLG